MLKMSTRSSYAIRALITLARQPAEAFARLSTVAQEQHIPLPYLEQIFAKLRKAGLVDASRGPQGGYKLVKNPADITLAEIVYVLEGPPEPRFVQPP